LDDAKEEEVVEIDVDD